MSIFDRGIRGNVQNPFNTAGDASTVSYSNPRMPSGFNGNVQMGLDYILDALYPNYKGTVPNKAALPTTATANDYYIVADDGDGKSAGYVYSVVEGVTQWIKRYDVDYSAEGILAEAIDRTSYLYVGKYGVTDKDANGTPITGTFAGQTVYGGNLANQNLTFYANKVDLSGQIQFANTIVPLNATDLGTTSNPFRTIDLSQSANIGSMMISPGNINDSSGQLNIAPNATFQASVNAVNGYNAGNTQYTDGQIFSSSANFGFNNANLDNITNITASELSLTGVLQLGSLQLGSNGFSGATAIDFGSAKLTGVNSITAQQFIAGDTTLSSDSLSCASGPLTIHAGGTNAVTISSPLTVSANTTLSGTLNVTGSAAFSSTVTAATSLAVGTFYKASANGSDAVLAALSGALNLSATSPITVNQNFTPATDNAVSLGSSALRFTTAYLSGGVSDGTNTTSTATLTSLRNINSGATNGMSLFYNGSTWVAQTPTAVIMDHRMLTNLTTGDSGHTQFALLAGRAGGQTLLGGTASGENLTLDSTSNATKGLVLTSSVLAPTTTQATDFGTSAKQWRNVYTSGIFYGLRLDQYAGSGNYPANASANTGRIIFDTSASQVLVDTGTAWAKVGNQKWLSTITADGTTTSYAVTVSSTISDARTGIWQLADNTNGYQRVQANLTITQSSVTVTASPPLPSGSYTLIGFN